MRYFFHRGWGTGGKAIGRNFLILAMFMMSSFAHGQNGNYEYVYVVQLGANGPGDFAKCYTDKFDLDKFKLAYSFEDTINNLTEFIFEEEQLYGPDCFVPELKLIFRDYTYIVSLYCTRTLKYSNASPFVPSSQRLPNDLVFTQSVYDYLDDLKAIHFGRFSHRGLIEQINEGTLPEELTLEMISDSMLDEDPGFLDDDDLDLEDFDDELLLDDDDLDLDDFDDELLFEDDDGDGDD